ncbi:MAG: ABC transporter ATP-binding protein [Rhodospirillaceae bacterium]
MSEPILSMHGVCVAYQGDITILDGVSLDFVRGEIAGLIGPNGAGKSTVLKTLCGFLKPRSGSIRFEGQPIDGLSPHARIGLGIAYVPQHRSLFDGLTVEGNLRLGCWTFRRDKARVARALARAYELFPALADKRKERAGALSGGQQRFLELARALIVEPQVILLDEPTAMIAPRQSHEIYEFIGRLGAAGNTVVLVDQNVRQCAAVSDRIHVLELGRNKASGTRADLSQDGRLQRMIGEWLDYKID